MNDLTPTHHYRRFYKNYAQLFKSTEVQAYTMVALSLFTISFFGAFAIRPTLKTISLLKRQITDRIEVNQKLEEKINALILAQEEYQRIDKDLSSIYSLLPEKTEFPVFLRKLEAMTLGNGATISSIQFDPIVLYAQSQTPPSATTKPNATIPGQNSPKVVPLLPLPNTDIGTTPIFFSLTLQGPYQNLINLLDQLTRLDRLTTISKVDLTGDSTSKGAATLNISIQSQAYYFPEVK